MCVFEVFFWLLWSINSEESGRLKSCILFFRHHLEQEGFGTDWEAGSDLPDLSGPNYNGIVVARGTGADEQDAMRAYSQKYGTRVVYTNADFSSVGQAVVEGGDYTSFIAFDPSSYAHSVGDVLTKNKVWSYIYIFPIYI